MDVQIIAGAGRLVNAQPGRVGASTVTATRAITAMLSALARAAFWAVGALSLALLVGCGAPAVVTDASPADGATLCYVPAGEFRMGAALLDPQRFGVEKPRHTVRLDAYWIDRLEVSNAQFARFVEATGYCTDAERAGVSDVFDAASGTMLRTAGADWRHPHGPASDIYGLDVHPVVQVSWNDASAYCAWAGRRLPTEAEWERAARGLDSRRYPWGDSPPAGDRLNYADRRLAAAWADQTADDGYTFTAPAGSYPAGASPFGALDMAGNVWEWVSDWFDPDYYEHSPIANPPGPASGAARVLRGGGWSSRARGVRTTHRDKLEPDRSNDAIGFRCAR